MNLWVERSIELANAPGYLDKLGRIYSVESAQQRDVRPELLGRIREAHASENNAALIESLMRLDKYPVDDPYVRLLKKLPNGVEQNPETVDRLAERIRLLQWEQLEGAIKAPIVANRRLGNRFYEWLKTLGYPFLNGNELPGTGDRIAFLAGSDEVKKTYAREHLGYVGERGLDLLVKHTEEYIIGEAKFFADHGGNQNNNFNAAMNLVNNQSSLVETRAIAVLDGVVWLGGRSRMYQTVISTSHDVMSALLLPDYLESLPQRVG